MTTHRDGPNYPLALVAGGLEESFNEASDDVFKNPERLLREANPASDDDYGPELQLRPASQRPSRGLVLRHPPAHASTAHMHICFLLKRIHLLKPTNWYKNKYPMCSS